MTQVTYEDLIRDAFINPIRSVLIVDDDYPTLHEILMEDADREKQFSHKDWNKSPQSRSKVRKVIEEFRRPNAPFLLDIHDGTSPSEETDQQHIGTLHQTDLLILDYQLDKSKEGDGAAAIKIAHQALLNKHFNLILVHTQEVLSRVFYDFLISLLMPCFSEVPEKEIGAPLQTFLDSFEGRLIASVSDHQYVEARFLVGRDPRKLIGDINKGESVWRDVSALLTEAKLNRSLWMDAVKHALMIFEINNTDRFSTVDLGVTYWGIDPVMFIRASRGFIAFKSKDDGDELLPAMSKALIAWDPRPPRLMLTKLRAEMNERGIEVQDDALGNPEVGAVWYEKLLDANERSLDPIVDQTVRNHAEQLLDRLLPEVSAFAKKIIAVDAGKPARDVVLRRFQVNLQDPRVLESARMGHNAFVGSKPVKSFHLELGHVLRLGDGYWLCLTPACDMIPKRHRGSPLDRVEGIKRFTALQLVPKDARESLRNANRGGQVFVNVIDKSGLVTERLSFSAATQVGASPAWMTMYVHDDGYLPQSKLPQCQISYVTVGGGENGSRLPVMKSDPAEVCGMLRYEYALEIQSKFVASQSRIGLDFLGSDEHEDVDAPEAAKNKDA